MSNTQPIISVRGRPAVQNPALMAFDLCNHTLARTSPAGFVHCHCSYHFLTPEGREFFGANETRKAAA